MLWSTKMGFKNSIPRSSLPHLLSMEVNTRISRDRSKARGSYGQGAMGTGRFRIPALCPLPLQFFGRRCEDKEIAIETDRVLVIHRRAG